MVSRRSILLAVALVASISAPVVAVAGTVAVDACGLTISGGNAVLTQNLDCTGFTNGIVLDGADLDLAGFEIRGARYTVRGLRGCAVTSAPVGGVIEAVAGETDYGVLCTNNIRVSDVVVAGAGNAGEGITSIAGRIRAERITVSGWDYGLHTEGDTASIRLRDATVTGNARGVAATGGKSVRLQDCSVSGNLEYAVAASKATIHDSVITGNGFGAVPPNDLGAVRVSRSVNIRGSDVSTNAPYGIWTRRLKAAETTISANTISGTYNNFPANDLLTIKIKDSTVTGNGTSPDCGVTEACADISSLHKQPRLLGTSTCDRSYVILSGIPGDDWDVCALD